MLADILQVIAKILIAVASSLAASGCTVIPFFNF